MRPRESTDIKSASGLQAIDDRLEGVVGPHVPRRMHLCRVILFPQTWFSQLEFVRCDTSIKRHTTAGRMRAAGNSKNKIVELWG